MISINGSRKFILDNSPGILTGLGLAGTLAATYFTGTATFKAADVLREYEEKELSTKEKIKLVWKFYIPAGTSALLGVGGVVCGFTVGYRRTAALALAYTIAERAYDEYKEKVVEQYGATKEGKVRDSLAQDRVSHSSDQGKEIIILGTDVLCHDAFSGRYFTSSVEKLRSAQNKVNYLIINDSYASLSYFYNLIGLPITTYSEEVGWTVDHQLDLSFSTVLSEDGRPCVSFTFSVLPVRNYWKLY